MRSLQAGRTRGGFRPILLLAALLLVAFSCEGGPDFVGTLHVPYTRDDLVSDNGLLGTWASGRDTLTFLGMEPGHYRMGHFKLASDSDGTGAFPPQPMDVYLFQIGDAVAMDWGGYQGFDLGGDVAGGHITVPLRVFIVGDTLVFLAISPHYVSDSTAKADSIVRLDRGDVRFLRGSEDRVRQALARYLDDPEALEDFDQYVRVPMGQGPDAVPEDTLGAKRKRPSTSG